MRNFVVNVTGSDNDMFQRDVNKAIKENETDGYILSGIEYSTAYSKFDGVTYSALLIYSKTI